MLTRPVLLTGSLDPVVADSLRVAARQAGLLLEELEDVEQLSTWLDRVEPAAILIGVNDPGAEAICLRVRSLPKLSSVPIIGVTPELTDLSFPELYGWGGDDLIHCDCPNDLVPRLRGLNLEAKHEEPKARGYAIVGDPDRRRRIVVARVLRNAGFDVRFVVKAKELDARSDVANASLLILDEALDGEELAPRLSAFRQADLLVPCVLTCEPKKMPKLRAAIGALDRVAIADAFAPPEDVLFVANELGRAGTGDARSSARVLYGSVVVFRRAGRGRDEDAHGFTYNVSEGGLYVRTLAPLGGGEEVWLELRPPRTDRVVRLEGKVAWRRRFGPTETATVPPGFGVQITDATQEDRRRFVGGYQAFLADVVGQTRTTTGP